MPGVIDRFDSLRHDSSSAATTMTAISITRREPHLGEGLVPGSIETRDRSAFVLDAPGADHLRDAAGLGGGDVAGSDLVEQRRLAMVDVPHDRHDGGPRRQFLRIGRHAILFEQLFLGVERLLDLELAAQVDRQHLGRHRVDVRIDGHVSQAVPGQAEQQVARFDAQPLRKAIAP